MTSMLDHVRDWLGGPMELRNIDLGARGPDPRARAARVAELDRHVQLRRPERDGHPDQHLRCNLNRPGFRGDSTDWIQAASLAA
jgi:hypothetical protein